MGSSRQQKLNEEQRNIYEAEPVNCVNSSEDEEIKKELTSILPNGQDKPEIPQLVRPRFFTNPNGNCNKSVENYSTSDSSEFSAPSGEDWTQVVGLDVTDDSAGRVGVSWDPSHCSQEDGSAGGKSLSSYNLIRNLHLHFT